MKHISRTGTLASGTTVALLTVALSPAFALSTIDAIATVDGDAANQTVSAQQKLVDSAWIKTRQSWVKDFTTTWTAGVEFRAPKAKSGIRIAELQTTVSKDTGDNAKHDVGEPGEQGTDTTTELWLNRRHGNTLELTPRLGLKGVRAKLIGGSKPRLTVTGLPRGTFRLTLTTTGKAGSSVFALTDGCAADAEPMTSSTRVNLANGKHPSAETQAQVLICNGEEEPLPKQ